MSQDTKKLDYNNWHSKLQLQIQMKNSNKTHLLNGERGQFFQHGENHYRGQQPYISPRPERDKTQTGEGKGVHPYQNGRRGGKRHFISPNKVSWRLCDFYFRHFRKQVLKDFSNDSAFFSNTNSEICIPSGIYPCANKNVKGSQL